MDDNITFKVAFLVSGSESQNNINFNVIYLKKVYDPENKKISKALKKSELIF